MARHLNPDLWQEASSQHERVYCLGKCYAAPASSADDKLPAVEVDSAEPIILSRIIEGGARTVEAYARSEGYSALEQSLSRSPEEIIRDVEISSLRGRGGAGFPTGKKWRAVSQQPSLEKFVIANADEGDPGAFVDRFIMEYDPHSLIEGLMIAGYAVGATRGFIYLRAEYPLSHAVLQEALADARRAGLLGENILHSGFSFDIEIAPGQGSYVCGEETALINSIEGRRPEAQPRPPFPTQCGLFGKPTLVNNVETLANIPWIIRKGGDAYRRLGFSNSRGTKVVSLNSLFNRPGLYEIEFGVSVRHIVEELGGGLKTGEIRGVIIGGPLAGIIPPPLLDTPFGFEELRAIGASVGHGGAVAFDERTSIPELIHHVFDFGAYESCGRCTPCRAGSRRVEKIFERILANGAAGIKERTEFDDIVSALAQTSLCGLGTGLA
ncbi:MAG TPA: NADH-ubiquinone oxidoreductase-F iron-sulfur binding region domain-containing protein, partial [Blastocatellia bacterium]